MTELGEGSVSPGSAPPRSRPRPPAVTTGTVEVTVNLAALCWDTFADATSTDDSDRALAGATVRLQPATGAAIELTTPDDGKLTFPNVPVGAARVRARRVDYGGDGGAPDATATVTVTAGMTVRQTLVLTSRSLECSRKHTRPPSGTPGPDTLGPIFWADEPGILIARDVIWLVFTLLSAFLLILGLAWPPASGCIAAGALCFAIFAFATHVIFGMIPGVISLVAGFAMFLALLVFTILALLTTPPLPIADSPAGAYGMPGVSIFFFPPLCAIWPCFAIGLAAGRQPFSHKDWIIPIITCLVGAVLAMVVFIVIYAIHDPVNWATNPGYAVGGAIAQFIAGAVAGFLGGFMGHVFINDGNLDSPSWGLTDLELPFEGERYCVQGHRGFISHFYRVTHGTNAAGAAVTWTTDEEFSYDWSFPLGHPILAAKEGHIIAFKEDRDGNVSSEVSNSIANYVYVRHKDMTVAHYLHCKQGGFTDFNPSIAALGVESPDPAAIGNTDYNYFDISDPVHVHAGQQLAPAGNVGYSMFSHLHFAVQREHPLAGRRPMPVKFKDADVASHEGRCFSMRKYRSSNVDRGRCTLPPP